MELSGRGNEIEEQNVDYAITMGMEEKESVLTEIDKDTICHKGNNLQKISLIVNLYVLISLDQNKEENSRITKIN